MIEVNLDTKNYFSGKWWRDQQKFLEAIKLFGTDSEISRNLCCRRATIQKWRKIYNIDSQYFREKQFCKRNHDTHKTGRDSQGHCLECERLRAKKDRIKRGDRINFLRRERKKSWSLEKIELEKQRKKILYERQENDPIKKMLRQTRSRLRYHEKRLKEYN